MFVIVLDEEDRIEFTTLNGFLRSAPWSALQSSLKEEGIPIEGDPRKMRIHRSKNLEK